MPRSIPAIITPKLLVWAREEAGYSIEAVAGKMKRPAEDIRAWEAGEKRPTLRQAEALAKMYQRSYALFTLDEPPQSAPLASEYRRLPNITPGNESPELRFALREMISQRDVSMALAEAIGERIEPFVLNASLTENPAALAARIRSVLAVPADAPLCWKDDSMAWREYRNAIEALGVFVFVFSGVETTEVRGVSLFHSLFPVIGINSREITASRPFTLLHEFVHLLLANAREEKSARDETRTNAEWETLERFVEKVVGNILIPGTQILAEDSIRSHGVSSYWSVSEIARLARRYKVTPAALAARLLELKRLNYDSYRTWKTEWQDYLRSLPAKKRVVIVPQTVQSLNRNGTRYSRLVIEALNMDQITPVQASRFLKIRFPYVEEMRLHFVFGRPLSAKKSKGDAS